MTRKKNKREPPRRLLCALIKERDDGPPVQSLIDKCGDCGRAVWRALSSNQEVVPICRSCLAKAERAGGFKAAMLPPSPQQLAEIEQVLGSRRAKRLGGSEN